MIRVFYALKKRQSFKIVQLPQFLKIFLRNRILKYDIKYNSFVSLVELKSRII